MQTFIHPQAQTKLDLAGNQKLTPMPTGSSAASLPSTSTPSHQDIASRAYAIYVKNDCKEGRCDENWRQAESDLRSQNPPDIKTQQDCGYDVTSSARQNSLNVEKTTLNVKPVYTGPQAAGLSSKPGEVVAENKIRK